MSADIKGNFAEPPAHAPREVAVGGLDAETIAQQLALAQQHERELAPLTFAAEPLGAQPLSAQTPPAARSIRRVGRPAVGAHEVESVASSSHAAGIAASPQPTGTDHAPPSTADPAVAALGAATATPPDTSDPIAPYQKAGSNTDSPSRGVPRAIDDPGKVITGGFGDAFAAQYFPLDGSELRELVLSQMDVIAARLQNDLRFSLAITYPRVTARVCVEVEAFAHDQDFRIERVVAHDHTPIDVARVASNAGQIVFVLVEQAREMTPDGESETPPNQVRHALGLPIPRKQRIDTPGGGTIVDQVTTVTAGGQ